MTSLLVVLIPFLLHTLCVSSESPTIDRKGIPNSTLHWHKHLSILNLKLVVETPFELSFVGMVLPLNDSSGVIVFGRNDAFGLSSVEIRVWSGNCVMQGFPSEEYTLPSGNLEDAFSGTLVFFYDTHTILDLTWDFRQIFSEYDWEISLPEMKIFLIEPNGQHHEKIHPLVLQTGSETVPYTPKQEKNSDNWHVIGDEWHVTMSDEWNVAVGGEWQTTTGMPKRSIVASNLDNLGYTMTQNLININGSLDLYWKPVSASDTSISFALVGESTGWLGVGFSQSGFMVVSDAIVGYIDTNGVPSVHAYPLTEYAEPQEYLSNLVVSGVSGTQENGTTTLFFTRDFNSGNFPIVPVGQNLMVAAFQQDNEIDLVYHGTTRQPNLLINFSPSSTPPTTPPSSTLTPPVSIVHSIQDGTLQDQGYTFSEDIIPGVLTVYWKPFSKSDTTISYALVSQSPGYLAMGWSPDGQMIGSDAVIGWVQNGVTTIEAYYLEQEAPPTSTHPNLPLYNTTGTDISGVTTIFFIRDFNSGFNPIYQNVFMNVIGSYQADGVDGLIYHGPNSRAAIQIDFSTGAAQPSLRPFGAQDAHALLMFLSWGLILPLGMLWARYARNLPNSLWFKVHRVSQYSGIVIALIGFTVILATTQVHYTTEYHGQLGTLVIILAVAQAVGAFFRPHKDPQEDVSKQRQLFEYFHWWNGRTLVVLGIEQMFSGAAVIGYPIWLSIVYGILVALVVVGVAVREVQNYFWPIEKDGIVPCFKVHEKFEVA